MDASSTPQPEGISAMIDNLEWVDNVLSGGCHALIKGTNERYWITPHRGRGRTPESFEKGREALTVT
jgi:hypothetical protein